MANNAGFFLHSSPPFSIITLIQPKSKVQKMSIFTHKAPEFDIKINKFPLLFSALKENKFPTAFAFFIISINVWLHYHNFSEYTALTSSSLSLKEIEGLQSDIIANTIFFGFVAGIMALLSIGFFVSVTNDKAKEEAERRKVLFLGKTSSSQVMDYVLSNKQFTSEFFLGHDDKKTVFQELIHSGINLNYQNSEGDTALHLMTRYDMAFHVILEMLLLGADPTITNNKGEMPASKLDRLNNPLWINFQKLKFAQNVVVSTPNKTIRL